MPGMERGRELLAHVFQRRNNTSSLPSIRPIHRQGSAGMGSPTTQKNSTDDNYQKLGIIGYIEAHDRLFNVISSAIELTWIYSFSRRYRPFGCDCDNWRGWIEANHWKSWLYKPCGRWNHRLWLCLWGWPSSNWLHGWSAPQWCTSTWVHREEAVSGCDISGWGRYTCHRIAILSILPQPRIRGLVEKKRWFVFWGWSTCTNRGSRSIGRKMYG